jgi:hypothetical protein
MAWNNNPISRLANTLRRFDRQIPILGESAHRDSCLETSECSGARRVTRVLFPRHRQQTFKTGTEPRNDDMISVIS